jgi:hypothetical protein
MRRLFSAMSAAALALTLSSAASGSNPSRGADVFGVGGGEVAGKLVNFDMSMHSGKTDFGHVQLKRDALVAPLDLYVDVTCVKGLPGIAPEVQYSGRVRTVTPVPNFLGVQPGDPVSGYASDDGNPSSGVPVDALTLFTDQVLVDCKLMPWTPPANNVTSGNVNVKLG